MKKIIFSVVCFLSFIISSEALSETYYSDYGSFSEFMPVEVESNDTVLVEKERRYRLYNEVYTSGDYYIEGLNPSQIPLKDENNYKYTNFNDWGKILPNNYPNRIIENRNVYEYQDIKKIRYIHLYDVNGSYNAFRVPEIMIYSDSKKINYTYSCEGCHINFKDYIDNGIYKENMSVIENGGYLKIDLGSYYDINSLVLKIYLFDTGTSQKEYTIGITRNDSKDSLYFKVRVINAFTYIDVSEVKAFTYTINQLAVKNPEWEEPVVTTNAVVATKSRKVSSYKQYRYKDKLFYYYNYEKKLSNDYETEINSLYPYMDLNDYIDYYRYQKRDKLVLNNNLIIDSYDIEPSDFIISSTTDVDIKTNLDKDTNGIYDIEFITSYKTIKKNIVVDISENAIKELELLNDKINDLESKNNDIKEYNENLLDDINSLEQKVDDYNKKINNLNENIVNSNKNLDKLNKKLIKKENIINRLTISNDDSNKMYQQKISLLQAKIESLKKTTENNKVKDQQKVDKTKYSIIGDIKTLLFLLLIIVLVLLIEIFRRKMSHQKSN